MKCCSFSIVCKWSGGRVTGGFPARSSWVTPMLIQPSHLFLSQNINWVTYVSIPAASECKLIKKTMELFSVKTLSKLHVYLEKFWLYLITMIAFIIFFSSEVLFLSNLALYCIDVTPVNLRQLLSLGNVPFPSLCWLSSNIRLLFD